MAQVITKRILTLPHWKYFLKGVAPIMFYPVKSGQKYDKELFQVTRGGYIWYQIGNTYTIQQTAQSGAIYYHRDRLDTIDNIRAKSWRDPNVYREARKAGYITLDALLVGIERVDIRELDLSEVRCVLTEGQTFTDFWAAWAKANDPKYEFRRTKPGRMWSSGYAEDVKRTIPEIYNSLKTRPDENWQAWQLTLERVKP